MQINGNFIQVNKNRDQEVSLLKDKLKQVLFGFELIQNATQNASALTALDARIIAENYLQTFKEYING